MPKFSTLNLAVFISFAITGCANISDSYNLSQADFKQYENLARQYHIQENWWENYQDPQLNRLIEQALANNKDLAKAAIAVNIALYKANLIGADLVPTFSAETLSSSTKNIETGGNSATLHEGSLNVGYTLDLWQRLADSTSAAKWAYEASGQDLAAARLSLINAVITTYYRLAFLNDAVLITRKNIEYYQKIDDIMQNKFKLGLADSANMDQSKQAVLTAKNTLIDLQTQYKATQAALRNLLNLQPQETLIVIYPQILNIKNIGVNLDVPFSTIANRPDVKAKQFRLHSAFRDAQAMQKSWFPSITLGAGLSVKSTQLDGIFGTPFAAGLLKINLPFLSFNQVKWNVKISEAGYKMALADFEQSITTALNDIDKNYFAYTQAKQHLVNLQETHRYNVRITNYYKNRYHAGISELREWLTAAGTENRSQMAILNAKYSLIQAENAVYSAMGGYYSVKPEIQ